MPDQRHARGLIDTSVVIDLELIEPADLPLEVAVSAITMAELAAGPHATGDPAERAALANLSYPLRHFFAGTALHTMGPRI